MVVTHRLRMDMEGKEPTPWIDVVQGDMYTRNVGLQLFSGPCKWEIPEDASVLIRYRKPDGTKGMYDTLPDGTRAWRISENILTVVLAPQVMTAAGTVMMSVSILLADKIINTFAVEVRVRAQLPENGNRCSGRKEIPASEDYFSVTGILPVPDTAQIGQFIRVAAIDQQGKPTRTEAVDLPHTGNVDPEDVQRYVEEYLQENPPADGKAPVKGVDYWTDAEQETMLQDVIAALGTPVFGRVDASNNIILTGTLAEGTYILKYENADGSVTVIGTLDNGVATVFEVPITWYIGTRLNKDTGAVETETDPSYNASDFITLEPGVSYVLSTSTDCYNTMNVCYYDDAGNCVGYQRELWVSRQCEIEEGQPASGALVIPAGATKIRMRQYETWNTQGGSLVSIKLTGTRG